MKSFAAFFTDGTVVTIQAYNQLFAQRQAQNIAHERVLELATVIQVLPARVICNNTRLFA